VAKKVSYPRLLGSLNPSRLVDPDRSFPELPTPPHCVPAPTGFQSPVDCRPLRTGGFFPVSS